MSTINPYRIGLSIIYKRLLWDLNPQSWVSRKKIQSIKDIHKGEKCLILCNGPSLLKTNFELLKKSNAFSIGLNKVNLLFDKSDFRPDYIVAVNKFVIEQNLPFFKNSKIPLFLDSYASKVGISNRENVHFLHSSNQKGEFAHDCSMSINQGFTVTYVAIQLAYHMGFSEVSLVGCDHNFTVKGCPNQIVTSSSQDPNHFDPNYFSGGVKWQLPDLLESEASYIKAKREFEQAGRKIYNSTIGGKLEIFTRKPLEEFLS